MKNKKWILIMIIAILAILLVPYERQDLDDGGTVVYNAAIYKLVKWNCNIYDVNGSRTTYNKTKIYFFGDSLKSMNELLEMELKVD